MTENKEKLLFFDRATYEELQTHISIIANDKSYIELLDRIPDLILILNKYRQVVFANKAIHNSLAIADRREIYGKRPGEIFSCIHSFEEKTGCGTAKSCTYCGALISILQGLNGLENSQECRIITHPDNDSLTMRVTSAPMNKEDNDFLVFTLVDISDEKRREVLERIFFHDIFNTASSISSLAVLLDMELPSEYDEYKIMMKQSSSRLIDEIKSQRMILSAEKGDLVLEKTNFSLREFIQQIINTNKNYEFAKNSKIIPGEIPDIKIYTDRALLGRVMSNLTKNALEAVYPSGTVVIRTEYEKPALKLFVTNNTVMSEKVKTQIFKKSFSTKGTGRGIGTYSIKLYTEKYLKGKVSFTSSEIEGTTFLIEVPID